MIGIVLTKIPRAVLAGSWRLCDNEQVAIEPIPLHRDDEDRRPPGLIGGDINRILAGLGSPPAPIITRIGDAWADIVGPVVAEHTQPGRIADGRLRVDADGAAWGSQVKWQEQAILASISELISESPIVGLVIRVRPSH